MRPTRGQRGLPDSDVLGYRARRTSLWSIVRHGVPDECAPARLGEPLQDIADYRAHRGPAARMNFNYYRGRDVSGRYRCGLVCKECPVDVLIEEINKSA